VSLGMWLPDVSEYLVAPVFSSELFVSEDEGVTIFRNVGKCRHSTTELDIPEDFVRPL